MIDHSERDNCEVLREVITVKLQIILGYVKDLAQIKNDIIKIEKHLSGIEEFYGKNLTKLP